MQEKIGSLPSRTLSFSFLPVLWALFASHGGTFIKRKKSYKTTSTFFYPRNLAEKKYVMKK